ncbi:hypothetical protein LOTGIDRAFT_237761 [Lottia gigantea]|uniref:Uncharacterized protein n=1 Tax=Lottia gigantea TaxID=225164 RepID=V4B722_LOTGI|nr:hypothetical protein LOTGIDRAFT_237761 [Lottia gigantea]ESP03336.1 hypothetical protein LOTGIDRAFT_237761 [Lottia gigantea]
MSATSTRKGNMDTSNEDSMQPSVENGKVIDDKPNDQNQQPANETQDAKAEAVQDTTNPASAVKPDVTIPTAEERGDDNDVSEVQAEQEKVEIHHYDSVSNIKSNPDHFKYSEQSKEQSHRDESRSTKSRQKKPKKTIFMSYSPDASYIERKFVSEIVRQLKENNLADDIWFDKDEQNTDSPSWFSLRMEAIEKCRAVILVLSESYFTCPVSVYEGKTLLERLKQEPNCVNLFPIMFTPIENKDILKQFAPLMKRPVDLTKNHIKKSVAEKTSIVIGEIMEELEKFGSLNSSSNPNFRVDTEFTGEYLNKKICQWTVSDLQEWLFNLGIKEFYLQSLAENMIDGFLLMSLTDYDMVKYLGIDSRIVRKKIMQQILSTLDKEHKQPDNWHLRARAQRTKPDVVYLIYDPADVRLIQNIKTDLRRKGLQVIHHDSHKLGKSKEEFLRINGPQLATSSHVIVILTEAATNSPFVYQEVLFADWLGKKLVTAMFNNTWSNMRASAMAVLGDCPAINFETKPYTESLDVLEHHIKPLRRVPGVVLEQSYLNKMAEGLKPLEHLSSSGNGIKAIYNTPSVIQPKVYISFHWDMHARVEEMKQVLERSGFTCWTDMNLPRGHSRGSSRTSKSISHTDISSANLQGQIHRNMKESSIVLSCITPKYLQSENCSKDLTLAETFNKPIIPLLLRYTPLDTAPLQVRRTLLRHTCVDLSNDRLYKQNINIVLDKMKKLISPR